MRHVPEMLATRASIPLRTSRPAVLDVGEVVSAEVVVSEAAVELVRGNRVMF